MSQFDLLVVDDDERMRAWFLRALQADGCSVRIADTLAEARSLLQANPAQIAFVDFHLPDGTGDELIRWAVAERKIDAAYCMTAYAECGNVVAAMRAGAVDVFEKPVDIEFLRRLLATPRPAADEELSRWRRNYAADIIGNDPSILQLLRVIQRVARTTSTVLIHGESGSGKEQLAASIHRASARASRPFVALNCAAIPETLIESELFGHARGAFTGASLAREGHILSADGGTLFLDEIGDMPLPAQGKLLRVLQERKVTPVGSDRSIPVDVRIVAATHRDLDAMVEAHQFREDLYYRLSVIQMELPPLRERAGDIPAIAQFLVGKIATQMGLESLSLDDSALRALQEHEWPGNVRELSNAIERALVTATGATITARDLALPLKGKRRSSSQSRPIITGNEARPSGTHAVAAAPAPAPTAPAPSQDGPTTADLNLKSALDQVERQMIEQALSRTGGNRTEAAALLGLNRSTLVEKIRKLNG